MFRVRQIWGQGENAHGFRVTGGQMWSLVTEDARGTDNRTEVLPNTVDPQYMVGFNWARQPALRLQQRFGDPKTGTFTLAMSLEQAQITNFTANSATTGAIPANFVFAGGGANGGLYNAAANTGAANLATYANNVAPDVMVKAAFDAPHFHGEVGGLARFMRDYYHPILTTVAAPGTGAVTYTYAPNQVNSTTTAGGAFAALRVTPLKVLEFGISGMAGTGVGRYGSSQLADATLKPSGALEPIKNYHALVSVVTHEGKKLDIYSYYGGEYAQRTLYSIATGAQIGYGSAFLSNAGCYALPTASNSALGTGGVAGTDTPVTCAEPTRYIQEGMAGFTYRIVNSPKYGRLQYQATYSVLQRNLWRGATTPAVATAPVPTPSGPRAQDSMIHVGMRYYIP